MKVAQLSSLTPELTEFFIKSWQDADLEHYGTYTGFEEEKIILVARDENEINMGLLIAIHAGGVIFLDDIIVDKNHQHHGVGTELMTKLEEAAKEKNAHKIFLYTTAGWDAVKLYEKLGYKKTADLPNHYLKTDWVEYTKFLI